MGHQLAGGNSSWRPKIGAPDHAPVGDAEERPPERQDGKDLVGVGQGLAPVLLVEDCEQRGRVQLLRRRRGADQSPTSQGTPPE